MNRTLLLSAATALLLALTACSSSPSSPPCESNRLAALLKPIQYDATLSVPAAMAYMPTAKSYLLGNRTEYAGRDVVVYLRDLQEVAQGVDRIPTTELAAAMSCNGLPATIANQIGTLFDATEALRAGAPLIAERYQSLLRAQARNARWEQHVAAYFADAAVTADDFSIRFDQLYFLKVGVNDVTAVMLDIRCERCEGLDAVKIDSARLDTETGAALSNNYQKLIVFPAEAAVAPYAQLALGFPQYPAADTGPWRLALSGQLASGTRFELVVSIPAAVMADRSLYPFADTPPTRAETMSVVDKP